MLPTVEQAHAVRGPFPRRRVDAFAPQLSSVAGFGALRVLMAAPARGARPMSFLPLRARKAVVEAGSVRDGP